MNIKLITLVLIFMLLIPAGPLFPQIEPKSPKFPEGELAPVSDDFFQDTKENENKILKTIPADIKEDL